MIKSCIPLMVLLLVSCITEQKPIRTAAESPLPRVETIRLEETIRTPELNSFGSVSYRTKADVVAGVDGSISAITAIEGSFVQKGSLLASLKNLQVQIRYDQARAALGAAETAYNLSQTKLEDSSMQIEAKLLSIEKMEMQFLQKQKELEQQNKKYADIKELHAMGAVSNEEIESMEFSIQSLENDLAMMKQEIEIQSIGFRDSDLLQNGYQIPSDQQLKLELIKRINTKSLLAEVEVSKSKLDSAETELRSAELLLSELSITSPINGIVGAKYLETGERTKADTKLFTVFDSSEVDIVFPVPESKGLLLSTGMKVAVTIDALETGDQKQKDFIAFIRFVSPTVDPQSGSITVKAGMTNPEGLLRPGMFSRVKIAYDQPRSLLLIPKTCLINHKNAEALVFTVNNNYLQQVKIITGDEYDDLITVKSGLTRGTQLVNNPSPILCEGAAVEIIK